MCGITGVWSFDGRSISAEAMHHFNDSLQHRGPDDGDIFLDLHGQLGLGHRRLAIQDLSSAGRQPLTYKQRYVMTYNGEVYNFKELRKELEALGHVFTTKTDSEVVLAAYAQWREECLYKFNGMFAIAIWDRQEQSLFIALDRFAIKPCVYIHTPEYFAFASEIKALLHLDRYELSFNDSEFTRRLHFGGQDTVQTLLEGVVRIPAGHYLKVNRQGELTLTRWWKTLDHLVDVPSSYKDQQAHFYELLKDSVRLRMRSDAPVGIPLSGGMDSGSILVLMKELIDGSKGSQVEHLNAFNVSKKGMLDELPLAQSLISKTGGNLSVIDSSKYMSYDMMQKLTYMTETISTVSEGAFSVYQRMRSEGKVVSLDGHGGDELMAGYNQHLRPGLEDALGSGFHPVRALGIMSVMRSIKHGNDTSRPWKGWKMPLDHAKSILKSRMNISTASPRKRRPMLFKGVADVPVRFDYYQEDKAEFPQHFDQLNASLYYDFHFGFLQRILRSFDYASMANGVEVRTPFLDYRLVSYLFSLPSETKLGAGFTKRILRDSMKGKLGNDIRLRKLKTGFVNEMEYFISDEITSWIKDTLNSQEAMNNPLWDGNVLKRVLNNWSENHNNQMRNLYCIAQSIELKAMYERIKFDTDKKFNSHLSGSALSA